MSKHVRQTPADDDFRQWFTDKVVTLKQRSEMILRDGQEHHPMLFVFERDGASVGIVPLPPFETNLDKDIAAHLHKKLGEMSDRFDGVIMLVEAWAAVTDANYKYGDRISDRPDKFEILMFNGIRGTMQLLADFRINADRTLESEMRIRDPTDFTTGSTGRFIVGDDGQLDS